jgi:aspartate/tyrosine/aromatic aminotransferase
MFEAIKAPLPDALYQVAEAFQADTRSGKLDLGVGVYRDELGTSPIMECVRAAERALAESTKTKAYLNPAGHDRFLSGMANLAFGGSPAPSMAMVQTVGGTGGVRLALELAQLANPDLTVHLGVPSWPNHQAICDRLGIKVATYPYLDTANGEASHDNLRQAVAKANAGDVLILHGPCHNPTGMDLRESDVLEVLTEAGNKGVVPLIDAAYYGLGNDLDHDLNSLRAMRQAVPESLVILSGSKAFGLYRDRIGILFATCVDELIAKRIQARLQNLARVNYSGPAAHGAEVVGRILDDPSLAAAWRAELASMRERLQNLRALIAQCAGDHRVFHGVTDGKGIFALLPLQREEVARLASEHAIHMPGSGRINIAGLSSQSAPRLVEAVKQVVS